MDVSDLIVANAELLKGFTKSKKGRSNVGDDIFIYQNRPVENTNWRKDRNVVFVNVFFPTEVPAFDFAKSIVLHNHSVFERCTRDRYCHLVGYNVEDRHSREFNLVWNYLYYPQVSPVVSIHLDLSL